jgi:two-component system, chemotaxis family, sensor kinase CheA
MRMTIFAKLALGFGTVLMIVALTGGLVLWNVRLLCATDEHVRDRVSFNELALTYRHAAQEATLGASQLAAGNTIGEQRIREGLAGMRESRAQLETRLSGDAALLELRELERVEKLTAVATDRVVASVRAKSPPKIVQQELAFLSARADALILRLEALFDDTRAEVDASMAFSRTIGARVQTQTAYALAACVLFAMLVSALVFRSITRPLSRLDAGVRRIAEGHLEETIAVTSRDEIGQLTRAFNDMTAGLRRAMTALDVRNQDMRVVLDHVHQGLLTMTRDGKVSVERSAMVARWLGELEQGVTFWDHLAHRDPELAAKFQFGWEAVLEDVLPLELTLDQMPKRVLLDGRHLELEYRPIFEDEILTKVLIVISDISDRVARERASAHEREVMAMFSAIQRDKQGFLDFVAEGTALVDSLVRADAGTDRVVLKRQLHTLKGNSSIFGIASIASTCHELETRLADNDGALPRAEIERLQGRWTELGQIIASVAGDSSTRIEIDDEEFTAILNAIVSGTPRSSIARMIAHWRMERVQHRLGRFAQQARRLAEQLGKAPLQVRIEDGVTRLPRNVFVSFWGSFVHAVRNALDHGIEPPQERAACGKSEPATITLSTRIVGQEVAIEIADNGRGIDWDRIAAKAREHGLSADTEDERVQALFADGVSTAQALTDVSGRGVGMAALRDACAKLAGHIVIQSSRGEGTCISFRFPLQVMSDDTVVEVASLPTSETIAPMPLRKINVVIPR